MSSIPPPFKSDVSRPSALPQGVIRGGASNQSTSKGQAAADSQTAAAYLDKLEEGVNRSIDRDIQTLHDGFRELVQLASIRDKDKYIVAQEALQAEARADVMVRAALSLSTLSSSLSFSLLLSQSPDPALDQEAMQLIRETAELRRQCAVLLGQMGIGTGLPPVEDAEEEEPEAPPLAQNIAADTTMADEDPSQESLPAQTSVPAEELGENAAGAQDEPPPTGGDGDDEDMEDMEEVV